MTVIMNKSHITFVVKYLCVGKCLKRPLHSLPCRSVNSVSFGSNAPLGECLTHILFSDAASSPTW